MCSLTVHRTKLHKREQKYRIKTLTEFPNHALKDYVLVKCPQYTLNVLKFAQYSLEFAQRWVRKF